MILKHKKTQILFFAISFFCFIFILLFGLRNNVKDLNKELLQVKKGINEEQNLIKILESDFTNLSKSNRINKVAREKLGLEKTNSYQIKKLSDFYINQI
ncbi:MAG: septum formation initiator family protein [Alphaproteobacteria bacterium]|nr:septum formation initiator family protein [Alphaproteobacteria bacterium]|tara:strand:- start:1639 stop:1935 length:297 start_codon:yes stop_codon:yes gene_type:complete